MVRRRLGIVGRVYKCFLNAADGLRDVGCTDKCNLISLEIHFVLEGCCRYFRVASFWQVDNDVLVSFVSDVMMFLPQFLTCLV